MTHSTPNNFTEILAVLGGFVTLVTKFIGWGIKSYQIFQYRKSSVKKLYYYTRTKKKETIRRRMTQFLDTDPSAPLKIPSHDATEKDDKSEEHILLKAVILSKAILSYGYVKSFKIFMNSCCLTKAFVCLRKYFCCTKIRKSRKIMAHTRIQRMKTRAQNGQEKIVEELDLIQIVKTLRKARFLIDQSMDQKQQ